MNVLNECLCVDLKVIKWKQKNPEVFFDWCFADQTGW